MQSGCQNCVSGKYNMFEGGSCIECGEGKYSSYGATSCTVCQSGKFSASAGSFSCSSCPSGKVSNEGLTGCVCASGHQPNGEECEICAAGKFAATSSDACEFCQPGKYTESTGSSTCSDCAVGKYARSSGTSSCTDCPSGLTSRSDFQDCACDFGRGTVAPTGQLAAGTSIRLNVGTSSFVGPSFDDQGQVTGRLEMKLAFVGWGTIGDKDTNTYRFGEKEAQVACRQIGGQTGYGVLLNSSFVPSSETSSGYLTPRIDDLSCDPADSSLASCLNGAESTNADTSNSYDIGVTCKFAECGSCEHGKYSDSNENKECQNCKAGTYNPKNTSTTKSDCFKCALGSYSRPGSIECSSCPAELVQAEDGGSCACDLGRQPVLATPTGSLQYSSESTIRLSQSSSFVQAPSFSSDGTIYGRLEIKNPSSADGEWGTISGAYAYSSTSDSWVISSYGALPNIETAVVACEQLAKELGYYSDHLSAEVIYYDDDRVIEGYLDPVLTQVDCESTNSVIGECSYSSYAGEVPDENDYDIGVQCRFWDSENDSCEACVPGKISSSTSNELCSDCPQNFFSSSYGGSSCDACDVSGGSIYGPEGSSSDSMCFVHSGLWSNLYLSDGQMTKINDDVDTYDKESNAVWYPKSVSFVSRDTFLALNDEGLVYEYSSESMARNGTFATISNNQDDTSVLYLGHFGLVAVGAQDGIYFFALEDGLGGGNLGESSHDRFIDYEYPRKFCLGEFENELLIMTSDDKITRKCIPGTSCSSEREGVMVSTTSTSYTFYDVAVLKEKDVILVTTYNNYEIPKYSIRSCPLSESEIDLDMDCSLFENLRPTTKKSQFYVGSSDWQPKYIEVDVSKRVVYVLGSYGTWALDFDGNYIHWLNTADSAAAFNFRPHVAFQASRIQTTGSDSKAGSIIELPLDLNDHRNKTLSDEFDFADISSKILVRAEGYIRTIADGLSAKIEINGDIEHSGTSMTAKLGINFAGVWQVHVSGEISGSQVEFMNSPFNLTVAPDDTDASKTEVDFPSEVVAGNKFEGRFELYDAYQNPTSFSRDRLFAVDPSNSLGSLVKSSNGFWDYSTNQNLTKSGPYTLEVTLWNEHIIGSPFRYDVVADVPVPSKCGNTVKDMDNEFFSSGSTFTGAMVLKVTPRDQYDNLVLDAEGFQAHMRLISGGIPGPAQTIDMDAVDQYETEVPIAEEAETVIEVGILYNGEFLEGSPKIITVKPDTDDLPEILGGVGAGVVLIVVVAWWYLRTRTSRKLRKINNAFAAQRVHLEMEVKNLHESLRKKKHSEKEIDI
ncbi:hypothetical protein TrLO_g8680, partial [Triparma laevis f. longispina]